MQSLLSFARAGAAVLLLLALIVAPATGQRIVGPGADAVTLPRGTIRVGIVGEHTVQRDRWRNGNLDRIGGTLTGSNFGPAQFSTLGPLQQLVRDLGVPDFSASLGAPRLDARQRLFVTPLAIEYGVTDWLTVGVRAPLVRSKAESQFRIRGDSGRATLGPNPIFLGLAVSAGNATTIGRFSAASTNLGALRAACQVNPGAAPECPTILGELASVDALVASTAQFATGLTTLYGAGLIRGRAYVPMAGSAAESALLARVDSIRAALVRYGITDVTAGTGLPLGAQAPLTTADVARMIADSIDGFGARPLADAGLTAIGDVDISAKLRLFDSFARAGTTRFDTMSSSSRRLALRQSVLVQLRLGTGTPERADAFLDLGAGTGRSALTVRSLTDVVLRERFWATLAVGITQEARGETRLRVPSTVNDEWLESWREAIVPVTPALLLDVELSPRWQMGDYVAIGAVWQWRSQGASTHEIDSTGTPSFGAPVPLRGTVLDAASGFDEQRVGWTVTYSTLAARARGKSGRTMEIGYTHLQGIASGTGLVPKRWEDRIQLRYYARFLGR